MKSKKDDKKKFFNKNFKLKVNIKNVFLDQNNTINNLKGYILFIDNEITELNLDSKYLNEQSIKITIKKNNSEKITTLFSKEQNP